MPGYVMGIDVGTGGVRVVICDARGDIAALASQKMDGAEVVGLPAGWHEQRADAWWSACVPVIREALAQLAEKAIQPDAVKALAVTSTSGTVLPLDSEMRPLRPALMYNDGRASQETDDLNAMSVDFAQKMGRTFATSYALPRILWVKRHEPELFDRTAHWIHANEYIVGKLTGEYGVSDHSTALKTGYDLIDLKWPDFIEQQAGIPLSMLPHVIQPGETIARVSAACAAETGLSAQIAVCAGMTDGSTGLLATGATDPGDWNSTIGTTLIIKGITRDLLRDPQGAVYCHLHPMGWWLPGAASNVGGECLDVKFKGRDLEALGTQADARGPSSVIVYPLVRRGERFPFSHAQAEGFVLGDAQDEVDLYRGYLEGVGFTERLAYMALEKLGATVGERVYVAGGATHSRVWLQIRADILGKTLLKPALPESSMGAAILAASHTLFANAVEAGRSMVRLADTIEPRQEMRAIYDEKFGRFVEALTARGYLS